MTFLCKGKLEKLSTPKLAGSSDGRSSAVSSELGKSAQEQFNIHAWGSRVMEPVLYELVGLWITQFLSPHPELVWGIFRIPSGPRHQWGHVCGVLLPRNFWTQAKDSMDFYILEYFQFPVSFCPLCTRRMREGPFSSVSHGGRMGHNSWSWSKWERWNSSPDPSRFSFAYDKLCISPVPSIRKS